MKSGKASFLVPCTSLSLLCSHTLLTLFLHFTHFFFKRSNTCEFQSLRRWGRKEGKTKSTLACGIHRGQYCPLVMCHLDWQLNTAVTLWLEEVPHSTTWLWKKIKSCCFPVFKLARGLGPDIMTMGHTGEFDFHGPSSTLAAPWWYCLDYELWRDLGFCCCRQLNCLWNLHSFLDLSKLTF